MSVSNLMLHNQGCNCTDCEAERQYHRDYSCKWYLARPEHNQKKLVWRANNKTALLEQLGGRCALCGFQPITSRQIDFHETDGHTALGRPRNGEARPHNHRTPSAILSRKNGLTQLQERIDRLVPLCKNCHILVHTKECQADAEARIKENRRTGV